MSMLAKWMKRASSLFTEKPSVKVDDFGMEHFLVYHGLVGSSPENQREFKDVRADITSAVNRNNSHNLCINLKLAPLWWEEKLQRIFTELAENPTSAERTMNTLLPEKSDDYEVQDYDPLRHQDWRVRANAALVLANLKVEKAQDSIIRALNATADNTTPAFCHISRALSAYRSDEAKEALAAFLDNTEPWIKVDAVNALSRWPVSSVSTLLQKAFSQHHDFIDYAAVALAKQHKPLEFLTDDSENANLGAALIVGLLDASQQTFSGNQEILTDAHIYQCLEPLTLSLKAEPSALKLRALVGLSRWLENNYSLLKSEISDYPDRESIARAIALSDDKELRQKVVAEIEKSLLTLKADDQFTSSALRHGLKLIGEIHLKETMSVLQSILETPQALPYRNEIVEALGQLGDNAAAPQLVKLAKTLVNVNERRLPSLSATSVLEPDLESSKTYWYILKALANLADPQALELILEATGDHASDKREEALASAVKIRLAGGPELDTKKEVDQAVARSLSDPSPQVRLQALQGVSLLKLDQNIDAVTKMINSQELSVSRASFETLEALVAGGHKSAVRSALLDFKKTLSSTVKIKRVDDFISQNCE